MVISVCLVAAKGKYYKVFKGDTRSVGNSSHGESNFGLQEVMNSNET